MNERARPAPDLFVSSMTPGTLWQSLVRQKKLIGWVLVGSLLLTGLATWMMTPAYRAVSTLRVEPQIAQAVISGEVNKPDAELGPLASFFRSQHEQLKSREFIVKVIDELKLEDRLFLKDFRTPWRKAFDNQASAMFGPVVERVKSGLVQATKPVADVDRVSEFLERLVVKRAEEPGSISMLFTSPDEALSAEVVNKLSGELYGNLMARVEQGDKALGIESGNVWVVDKAAPRGQLFIPDNWLNLILGGLIGLMLGAALALLREFRNNTVHSDSELQAVSGLPVLGKIPNVNKKNRRVLAMAAVREVGSPVAEAYRIAAANLKFASPEGMPRSLLITSLNPGEGKSTSSVNLTLSLAQMGYKVLLIDADLRRPVLHEKMALNNHIGLTEYLQGDIELSRVTQRIDSVNNAFVITAGMINLDPVEALTDVKMKALLTLSSQYFDVTVLDAPPLTGFADALLLAELSDATLLVSGELIGHDNSRLSMALEQLQRVKQNVIGWLIVKARTGIVPEQYYARYTQSQTRRKNLDTTLVTPLMLQKKGLNLTKDG